MPQLPDPSQLERRALQPAGPSRGPTAGIVERAQASSFAEASAQTMRTTQAVNQFGDRVAAMAAEEKKRLDNLRLEDTETQLLDQITELTTGTNGYQRKRQGDVLSPDYIKSNATAFDAATEKVAAGLANDEQRAAFKAVADKHKSSFIRGVMTHAMTETEAYEDTVFKGQLASQMNFARSQPTNPDAVIAGVEGTRAAVLNRLARTGVTDQATIDATVLANVGAVHANVIDAARKSGSITYANEYLNAKRGEMTPEQIEEVESRLKPATAFMQGDELAGEAFAMQQKGASAVEVQKFINSKSKDPEVRRAAQASMLELEQAARKDVQEKSGTVLTTFMQEGMTPAAYKSAVNSEEFLALPADVRAQNMDYMYTRMKTGERERDAKIDEMEREKESSYDSLFIMGAYTQDPDSLARMSDTQLASLQPAIGKANVFKLRGWRESIKKEGTKAKIDPDIEKVVLAEISGKENKIRAQGLINSALMDWRVEHPGSVPDQETQKAIASKALEQWVDASAVFFDKAKAYELKPGEGYPASFRDEFPGKNPKTIMARYSQFQAIRDAVRRSAEASGDEIPTDAEIMLEFKNRLKSTGNL